MWLIKHENALKMGQKYIKNSNEKSHLYHYNNGNDIGEINLEATIYSRDAL